VTDLAPLRTPETIITPGGVTVINHRGARHPAKGFRRRWRRYRPQPGEVREACYEGLLDAPSRHQDHRRGGPACRPAFVSLGPDLLHLSPLAEAESHSMGPGLIAHPRWGKARARTARSPGLRATHSSGVSGGYNSPRISVLIHGPPAWGEGCRCVISLSPLAGSSTIPS